MNETRYSDTNSFVRNLMALYAEAAGITMAGIGKPEPVAESGNLAEEVYLAMDWPTFIDVPR